MSERPSLPSADKKRLDGLLAAAFAEAARNQAHLVILIETSRGVFMTCSMTNVAAVQSMTARAAEVARERRHECPLGPWGLGFSEYKV